MSKFLVFFPQCFAELLFNVLVSTICCVKVTNKVFA